MGTILLFALSIVLNAATPNARLIKQHHRAKHSALDTTEALVEFDHSVEIRSSTKPDKETQLNQVEEQVAHLFGPLAEAPLYAVPKTDHRLTHLSVARDADDSKLWVIQYHYRGTMLIKSGDDKKFKIALPVNPDEIYEASAVTKNGVTKYPCTDEEYDTEDDFWYFWNPEKTGCKLEEGEDYLVFKPAVIHRVENIRKSYPDYARMVNRENTIRVDILMGMDDHHSTKKNRNPMISEDLNADTYRNVREALLEKLDYTEPDAEWTEKEIRQVSPRVHLKYLPWVETFTKPTKRGVTLEVRMFYGPSGIDEKDVKAFHHFLSDAYENAAVVVYDGHSGLGGHLDIPTIEDSIKGAIGFSKAKYQVYFFNSCSSYSYYNSTYLERKGGTKNLDIMVNGLATAFEEMGSADIALLKGIDKWAAKQEPYTYQELTKMIDSRNLFSVVGDEDNPTSLKDIE